MEISKGKLINLHSCRGAVDDIVFGVHFLIIQPYFMNAIGLPCKLLHGVQWSKGHSRCQGMSKGNSMAAKCPVYVQIVLLLRGQSTIDKVVSERPWLAGHLFELPCEIN
jgi:hypothetical protein